MKAVILAGGLGTRISEESHLKPKPMIEIGEMPILWHIMKELSSYGVKKFIICAGYKQHVIKEWFANYFLHTSDITFKFSQDNSIVVHNKHTEDWKVTVVDTGLNTATGGRVKRIQPIFSGLGGENVISSVSDKKVYSTGSISALNCSASEYNLSSLAVASTGIATLPAA